MTCSHKAAFHIKLLFASKPRYTCKECGAELEMTPGTKKVSKILNAVFIAALVYTAFQSSSGHAGETSWMVGYFALLGGMILAFFLLQVLILLFGKFEEVIPVEEPEPEVKSADAAEPQAADKQSQGSGNSQYTSEQLELMALYDYYAKKNGEEAGTADSSSGPAIVSAEKEEDTCEHVPAKKWTRFVPGKYDFVCEKCGKPITFTPEQKKRLNSVLMIFSFLVLIISFQDMTMPFWQFSLIVLATLAVCTGVQYFFVKRGKFMLKSGSVK